jgi:hypothetical protein
LESLIFSHHAVELAQARTHLGMDLGQEILGHGVNPNAIDGVSLRIRARHR